MCTHLRVWIHPPSASAVRWFAKGGGGKRGPGKKGIPQTPAAVRSQLRPGEAAKAGNGQGSWVPFVLGGVLVYGMGTYSAMLYFGGTESCACSGDVVTEADRRRAYEVHVPLLPSQSSHLLSLAFLLGQVTHSPRSSFPSLPRCQMGAHTYERDVCSGEAWMGISSLRKSLLEKVQSCR